jgi:hypothetical protein
VNALSKDRLWLMDIAREAGDRYYSPATGRCLIARDTYWYAISLLFDTQEERRQFGNRLLTNLEPEDATHTPATLLAILHRLPGMIDPPLTAQLERLIHDRLVEAAMCEFHDGNVNHPLAAYATLILGGERCNEAWAVDLGCRRLEVFRQRCGDHCGTRLRQSEMSEYNSPTYTALDLWFLALIAEHARSAVAQRLALFLEQRLWIDVAMHFHSPSQQFAGPHSRSYADDSMGGCSALHFTMAAAYGDPLFIEPALCYRYNHPSTLVQNALVAILPFHVPELARSMAWHKPLPYEFHATTYGESYHENSRRLSTASTPGGREFAFDEEVYPGGWSDLTTYMTEEYALGSASMPYVNAGHADSVMLRIRRGKEIRALSDFRSVHTRGVFNGGRVGEQNFCHVTQTTIDESYLYEEGRCATYQHNNTLIACYTPKRAGHRGVEGFRSDMLFTYHAPFDELRVNGHPVSEFPFACASPARICFRDFHTFGLILPLRPSPESAHPVNLWRCGDYMILSMCNYEGPPRDFARHALNGWWTGFVLALATSAETTWEQFLLDAERAVVEHHVHDGAVRTARYVSGNDTMEFTYDPFKESILRRQWNGMPECEEHFRVRAWGAATEPFCPPTLFGREVMP